MKQFVVLSFSLLALLAGCSKINDSKAEASIEEQVETPVDNTVLIPNQDVEYGFLSSEAPDSLSGAEVENVGKVNTFAVSMAKQFLKTVASNYVFSPVSLAYILGMLSDGATGQTRDEICAVLGFGEDNQQEINEFCRDLIVLSSRNTSETEVLELANTCVADNHFPMKEEYRKDLHNYYDALVRNLDFLEDDTVGYINKWAEDHTGGRINKVVDEVNGVMCLVNGMYFKGLWSEPFGSVAQQEKFYKETGETLKVSMMSNLCKAARYYKGNGFQVATMDYGTLGPSDYSMSVFLPDKPETINGIDRPGFYEGVTVATMLSRLDGETISKAITSSEDAWVYIQLPKYEINTDKSVVYDFKTMGIKTMFNEFGANFSKITDEQIHVSDIKHVASIKIDEKGTEAAVVSNADLSYATDDLVNDVPPIIYFIANHPFIFVISERTTGAILFMGCYREPI